VEQEDDSLDVNIWERVTRYLMHY